VLCVFVEMAEARRAANFSVTEKHLLLELVHKFSVVDNKETNKFSLTEKNNAWNNLAKEFSASSSVKRSAEQLKQVFVLYYILYCVVIYDLHKQQQQLGKIGVSLDDVAGRRFIIGQLQKRCWQ